MYAIVKDGSNQFRAETGERVEVDLRQEASPGQEMVFDQVLLVGGEETKVGDPTVAGAKVLAVVVEHVKAPKVRGLRKRDNNNSETRFGHRQKYTAVTIKEIVAG